MNVDSGKRLRHASTAFLSYECLVYTMVQGVLFATLVASFEFRNPLQGWGMLKSSHYDCIAEEDATLTGLVNHYSSLPNVAEAATLGWRM
jgi:hypothetical protein